MTTTPPTAPTRLCPCGCGQRIPHTSMLCAAGWAALPDSLRAGLVAARAARRRCGSEQERLRRAAALMVARAAVLAWYQGRPPSMAPSTLAVPVTAGQVAAAGLPWGADAAAAGVVQP